MKQLDVLFVHANASQKDLSGFSQGFFCHRASDLGGHAG